MYTFNGMFRLQIDRKRRIRIKSVIEIDSPKYKFLECKHVDILYRYGFQYFQKKISRHQKNVILADFFGTLFAF